MPSGTVTFLFTDIEGSTQLWEAHPDAMRVALARHDALVHEAVARSGGHVFKTVGDAFCAAFAQPDGAVSAALSAQAALAAEPWPSDTRIRVRMAMHTGEVESREGDYFGPPVNRVARLLATAHGGQTLLSQAVCDADGVLPGGASLRDLGTHRLKDLARPERVFELRHPLLRGDFPPIRSLSTHPNNLPQQLTSFVGRAREIAEADALLAQHRLLTLAGSGGSGKTRLALQVAAEALVRFPDGAWVAELASLSDPGRVASAIADAVGAAEAPGETATGALLRHLKDKQLLLVLDNCEHVLEASAAAAAAIVQQCPGVRLLATSREALGIAGEQRYRVPSLSMPDPRQSLTPDTLAACEAVQLILDRARLVRADFELTERNARAVASVCRSLDGIPLAIELAAARLDTLTVDEIDRRLDQRFALLTGGSRVALPRHRTLRALIDWSYELLTEREQRLLQRLSIFAGGFAMAAAERTLGHAEANVLDLVASLANKSLVVRGQTEERSRWYLLETVREYALEKLAASGGEAEARDRHCAHFLAVAEEAHEELQGARQAAWLDALAEDHENFRTALECSLAQADSVAALRFCAALILFWATRGHLAEGREWCERALRHPASAARTRERAKALHTAGSLAYYQGDYAAARPQFEEAIAIQRELGDHAGAAGSMNNLANVAIEQGDYAAAQGMHAANLAAARAAGDDVGIANALVNLGVIAMLREDYAAARPLYEECLAIRRRLGDQRNIAVLLNNLGNVAFGQGDLIAARSLHEEGLAIRRELGDRRGIALALGNLADLAFADGSVEQARALATESLEIAREIGDERQVAHALARLAAVLAAHTRYASAARIFGFLEAIGALADDDGTLARARAGMGDDAAFDRAWQEGRLLTREQAIALATGARE